MKSKKKTDDGRLPDTMPLETEGDLAAQMVAGIERYLLKAIEDSAQRRARKWKERERSPQRYEKKLAARRVRLRRMIGADEERPAADFRVEREVLAVGPGYRVFAARWAVLDGVEGEGLLVEPNGKVRANVIALPDCDWTPEMLLGLEEGVTPVSQFARRLAASGCRVLVPALVDRGDTYSGAPRFRMTNQPHREFIYRAAFELGGHIIGGEVQTVLAAADWLAGDAGLPVGVIGYGEGGLLALYAGACQAVLAAVGVSGYFGPRQGLWREPIYRNVFGVLEEFGDAELAAMVAPRPLVIEASRCPDIEGPPSPTDGRRGAAPGVLVSPGLEEVERELARARQLTEKLQPVPSLTLVGKGNGPPGSEAWLKAFLIGLGVKGNLTPLGRKPRWLVTPPAAELRRARVVKQWVDYTQRLLSEAEFRRVDFWQAADATDDAAWARSTQRYRQYFSQQVIGQLPTPRMRLNPRSRPFCEGAGYRGFEVVLDVYPEVFAYGILLVPDNLKAGEQRPVVVCQHGLEGRPQDVVQGNQPAYHDFAARLAMRGYVVFAPQNPYIGEDAFRVLQRQANPLGKSLFSFIVRQHERILDWLATLPYVDEQRMAFYGLSYGGKTAMRVPALVERYCLSICSADYDEWIWKNASTRHGYSYLLTGEYEMFEFDLGNTFNYAEMSWLICPRPFMVERGHDDGVAPDEWVAYEFARTKRRYVKLGIGDRAEIEFFDGPHTINGEGTFRFLDKHLVLI